MMGGHGPVPPPLDPPLRPGTTTSSFHQQSRLYCFVDTNQVRIKTELFLLPMQLCETEQSPGVRQIDEDSCQF